MRQKLELNPGKFSHYLYKYEVRSGDDSQGLAVAPSRGHRGKLSEALAAGKKTYLAMVRGYFVPTDPVIVETPIRDSGKIFPSRSVVQLISRCRV